MQIYGDSLRWCAQQHSVTNFLDAGRWLSAHGSTSSVKAMVERLADGMVVRWRTKPSMMAYVAANEARVLARLKIAV